MDVNVYMHIYICARKKTSKHIFMHTYIYIYRHRYVCVYIYIYMFTHMHNPGLRVSSCWILKFRDVAQEVERFACCILASFEPK